MTLLIAPVVEGETEVRCTERLLQRVWGELLGQVERLQVVRPYWAKRDQIVRPQGTALAAAVEEAARALAATNARAGPDARSLILLLIDAEGDCPATLAPQLLTRAARSDVDIDCVLPTRMLENWFVAAAESLRILSDLPAGRPVPPDPEACNGASWLADQYKAVGLTYKKPIAAPRFVAVMDLATCRATSPSFDKLCRVLEARLPPAPPPNPDADASGS